MIDDKMKEIMAKREALKGIRVLDITRIIYGPWASTLLSVMGAEVIHVEMPGAGDVLIRAVSPGGVFPNNLSPGMICCNANKYYAAIDMHKPEGIDLIKRLAAKSDVMMENFKAGTFDKWGIGYRQLSKLNPKLIYVSMQGFGNWGEMAGRPSYDAYAQGITGLAGISGFPDGLPIKSQAWIGDYLSGTMAAFLTLTALHYRKRSGKGQFIDLAQSEVLLRSMDWTWIYQSHTGKKRRRSGNHDMAVVPSLIARSKDGFVSIGAFAKAEFNRLCDAMADSELKKYTSFDERFKNADLIYKKIEDWAAKLTTDEIVNSGKKFGFSVHPVMNSETIFKDRKFNNRKTVWKFKDPIYGDMAYPNPLHLDKTPGRIRWSMRPVGFDNEYVLKQILGFDDDRIEKLYKNNVLGKWDKKLPFSSPPKDWDGKQGVIL